MPAIGYLSGGAPGPFATNVAAFREGLKDAGYVEGQNVKFVHRPERRVARRNFATARSQNRT
jgi:hypothetical protein